MRRDKLRKYADYQDIDHIDIYSEKPENGCWIRNIVFNFPVPVKGQDVVEYPLENLTTAETVCLLSKLSERHQHIEVKIDMEEMDVTAAESKATYEEIRDWVQDNYGFHVTNLNIAQVKRKHGFDLRENFNKPKSSNSRQPGCPDEKVKAIEAALKYFRMF